MTREQKWDRNLATVIKYIEDNSKLPSSENSDPEIKYIGLWLLNQKRNYLNSEYIMADTHIRKLWEDFYSKNEQLFMTNTEIWIANYNALKKYIQLKRKLPSVCNKNIEIKKLGGWTTNQKQNYSKKDNAMKDIQLLNMWESLINEYPEVFMSRKELWLNKYNILKQYIEINNKLPTESDEKILNTWVRSQKENYPTKEQIMSDIEIRKLWEKLISENVTLFMKIDEIWKNNLDKCNKYIQANHKVPSTRDKNSEIKYIGSWLSKQKGDYINERFTFKDINIRKLWEKFNETHKNYLMQNKEKWMDNLNASKTYIKKFGKKPSEKDTDAKIKYLGKWLSHQRENYSTEKKSMKDVNIRKLWEEFTEEFKYSLR
jgi:hypothetical protein